MAAIEQSTQKLQTLELPPGAAGVPYIIPSLCGEIIYIPTSKSAMRMLVTGKETDNAFAVVGTGGSSGSGEVPFHYHNEATDVFLCLKGQVNVWAGDQARQMGPGDFACVPPKTIHRYQIMGDYTEFLGLIVPGGWEEFFRFVGEPYKGPMFPIEDDRNPFQVLIPKLKAAAEEFDMVPLPRHPYFEPQPWRDTDNQLPGKSESYFLQNMKGPKYLVGGTICRPMATMAESNGRFTIASVEGSSYHNNGNLLAGNSGSITFEDAHHCFQVCDGSIKFTVNGASSVLQVGETVYVPRGSQFKIEFASRWAKAYVFSNAAGLVELLCRVGKSYEPSIIPDKAADWDVKQLEDLKGEFGYQLS